MADLSLDESLDVFWEFVIGNLHRFLLGGILEDARIALEICSETGSTKRSAICAA